MRRITCRFLSSNRGPAYENIAPFKTPPHIITDFHLSARYFGNGGPGIEILLTPWGRSQGLSLTPARPHDRFLSVSSLTVREEKDAVEPATKCLFIHPANWKQHRHQSEVRFLSTFLAWIHPNEQQKNAGTFKDTRGPKCILTRTIITASPSNMQISLFFVYAF